MLSNCVAVSLMDQVCFLFRLHTPPGFLVLSWKLLQKY